MRRVTLVPILGISSLLAALFLTACGGDDAPETPIAVPTETTTAVSKADFIEEADAICEEANTAIQQIADAGGGITEADQVADLRQSVVDDLNALGPPEEDRTTFDDFLTAMQAQVEAGKKIGLAVGRNEDTAPFEAELTAAKTDAATAAETYGFTQCGSETTGSATTTAPSAPSAPSAPAAPAPSAPAPSAPSGGTGGGVGPG